MPYFTREKQDAICVVKGTKENPGAEMHCYSYSKFGKDVAKKKAQAYLGALYVHVEDAGMKEGQLQIITDGGSDRWLLVSTEEMWDNQGELYTKEAMDYDIARVQRTKEYPELRLFHVRGFKLGQCDLMQRYKEWAVDQGYWYDTPWARWMKDQIESNDGTWRVSRGFYSVEATGQCRKCGADLLVRPIHFMVGVKCPTCKELHAKPGMLKRLQHKKTVTFDLSITDVPAVVTTAATAYSLTG
jgi:hypothetical protein